MIKQSIIITLFTVGLTACIPFKTLKSTTYIKANDAFVLGNNKHQKFSTKLTNTSLNDIAIWECPIDGGRHSPVTVKPNQTVKIKVDKNTALFIENPSNSEGSVLLNVKGDTGLSMGYKDQ